MITITLYRSDFKETADGYSFFDGVLRSLGIPESEWTDTSEIDIEASVI